MKTGFSIKGTLKLAALRQDGTTETLAIENTVVKVGLVKLATVLAGGSFGTALSHIALGNGSTAVAATDTALAAELSRHAATVAQLAAPDNNKVQFTKAFAQGAITGTFREAGIFDAASVGNMFNRTVFTDFVVGTFDTFTITWLLEVRSA
jgi:hypothetical protein